MTGSRKGYGSVPASTDIGPTIGGTLALHAGLRVPFLVTAGVQVCLAALILLALGKGRGGKETA